MLSAVEDHNHAEIEMQMLMQTEPMNRSLPKRTNHAANQARIRRLNNHLANQNAGAHTN
jgi:hypothetical protein